MPNPASALFAEVEIASISGVYDPIVFHDIMKIETNKFLSQRGAGNFTLTLGGALGDGVWPGMLDNDLIMIRARRHDNAFEPGDTLMIGQIDRVTARSDPSQNGFTIRGKDLTKQFLTNTSYIQKIAVQKDENDKDVAQFTGVNFNYSQLAAAWGCKPTEFFIIDSEQPIQGYAVECFLEKLLTNNVFIDNELLPGGKVIIAPNLFLFDQGEATYRTVYDMVEGVTDQPIWHWFVTELGGFFFGPLDWRTPREWQIITDDDWMSHLLHTQDSAIVGAVELTSAFAAGAGAEVGYTLQANESLLARYGLRMKTKQGKYVYNQQSVIDRAQQELALSFLSRISASVTVNGSNRWFVNNWAFVNKMQTLFYIDSVQHNIDLDKSSWDTTLGLELGRSDGADFSTNDAAMATITEQAQADLQPSTAGVQAYYDTLHFDFASYNEQQKKAKGDQAKRTTGAGSGPAKGQDAVFDQLTSMRNQQSSRQPLQDGTTGRSEFLSRARSANAALSGLTVTGNTKQNAGPDPPGVADGPPATSAETQGTTRHPEIYSGDDAQNGQSINPRITRE